MAPRGKMNEKLHQEQNYHYDIDVEAVHFEPILTTTSGIALNYHTSDHPEHKLLREESSLMQSPSNGSFESNSDVVGGKSSWCLDGVKPSSRAASPVSSSLEKNESFPRRYMIFIMMVGLTAMIALGHIMNVTNYLERTGITLVGEATISRKGGNKIIQTAYRNVNSLPVSNNDTAVYWSVSSSNDESIMNVLRKCLSLELQNDKKQWGDRSDESNKKQVPISPKASSKVPTIVVLKDIYSTADLHFDETHRGRLFSLFSHPVQRILSDHKRIHQDKHDGKHVFTLQDYMSTRPDNVYVRSLANVTKRTLTKRDLDTAKAIIQTKFLVGLVSDPRSSLQRFESYFGWKARRRPECNKNDELLLAFQQWYPQPKVVETDSKEHQSLAKANHLDLELYEFIEALFQEQAMLFQ